MTRAVDCPAAESHHPWQWWMASASRNGLIMPFITVLHELEGGLVHQRPLEAGWQCSIPFLAMGTFLEPPISLVPISHRNVRRYTVFIFLQKPARPACQVFMQILYLHFPHTSWVRFVRGIFQTGTQHSRNGITAKPSNTST